MNRRLFLRQLLGAATTAAVVPALLPHDLTALDDLVSAARQRTYIDFGRQRFLPEPFAGDPHVLPTEIVVPSLRVEVEGLEIEVAPIGFVRRDRLHARDLSRQGGHP